ncbi:endonuclease/exonuclease/phosphatase family protein [Chitinophaga qingshengii]|uniref:Endonuclease/exonuclease/phosphatase family protein n=1 Tax=Chitinophaga qingshengii TaxID=1569794 RepID=A0ABR7TQ83_9BACT|nr:endonuclease/exonuclease/phosphatase family protein [Chitinophaga qingshengii]MBC9932647.1 endonuclease/exonuclease/phosphatase family protein [Chitinophaga qingshengii]
MKKRFLLLIFCCLYMAGAQAQLRVLSYNILEGMVTDTTKGKTVFVDWVKQFNPDIVALQECNKFTQKSLEELAATWGHPYAVIVKENGYPTGLTSRYPITNIQKVTENMTHGFIMANVLDYNIVVLHLNPHKFRKRNEEMRNILANVEQKNNKKGWILMGDFNSNTPQDLPRLDTNRVKVAHLNAVKKNPNIENLNDGNIDFQVQQQMLDAGFVDALYEYDRLERATAGSDTIRSKSRIDYIYLSKDLAKRVKTCHFIYDDFTAKYSDHRPVYMELKK